MIYELSSKSVCKAKGEKNQYGHSVAILNTSQLEVEILILGEQKECIYMPNFQTLLDLAIFADENNPITFSNPGPEASPVLTLGSGTG